jgi:hypothetical protein
MGEEARTTVIAQLGSRASPNFGGLRTAFSIVILWAETFAPDPKWLDTPYPDW